MQIYVMSACAEDIMAYQTLYRKWRPKNFDDVVGQPHITETLKNEIKTGRLSHAYIFTGTRGTGKTSTAKILSRAVNCLNPQNGNPCNECDVCKGILNETILDVVEMDAASNNGVENIRDIIDQVRYATASSKYKVYIIDEVHMLSSGAFNALLKTLEEPPEHIIFILATTEIHKVLPTILSRCQRFDFKNITVSDISGAISAIMEKERINIDNDAVEYIAQLGNGSMRDALSILEQCLAYKNDNLTYEDVTAILGTLDDNFLYDMAEYIALSDVKNALILFNGCMNEGKSPDSFAEGLLKVMREIMIYTCAPEAEEFTAMKKALLEKTSSLFTAEKLVRCIDILSELLRDIKFVASARILVECTLVRIAYSRLSDDTDAILDRLSGVEKLISDGDFALTVNKSGINKAANEHIKVIPSVDNVQTDTEIPKKDVSPSKKTESALNGELSSVIFGWEEIKKQLQDNGKLILFVNLFGVNPKEADGALLLEFTDNNALKMVNTSENLTELSNVAGKLFGITPKIKCVLKSHDDNDNFEQNNDIFENIAKLSNSYPENFKID